MFDAPQEDPNYSPLPEDQSGQSWNRQDVEEDENQGQNEEDPQEEN